MRNKYLIKADIEFVSTLKSITQAYEEISVMKMQKIRSFVLKTREFMNKFSDVFYDVKVSYKKEIMKLMKKKQKKDLSKLSVFQKNGKTASVLISANTKLYGDIVIRVFHYFIDTVKNDNSDIIIIGKLGKEIFAQQGIRRPYMYFEIPDVDVKAEDLKPLVYNLVNYEKVNIFYGRFENIISQTPTFTNVSGDQPLEENVNKKNEKSFLFEPSLEKILQFFETQIFTSFLKQTVHESQLSRFASRIKAMEEALHNIDTRGKNLYSEKRKVEQNTKNKKQLETISGISLWLR